jgi:response regulator RpfG family c-di-GMP phosphodiesterase
LIQTAGGLVEEGQHITILVVDDEPAVLALVRRCLDDQRVTLIEASSGKDALELIIAPRSRPLISHTQARPAARSCSRPRRP